MRFIPSLFFHATLTHAYTTHTPNCTSPTAKTNFVSGPETRGTLDILWSSLFTIFACTWTVLHLNVPLQRDGQDPGWRGDMKWRVRSFWNAFQWMLIMLVAPELLIATYAEGLAQSTHETSYLVSYAEEDGVPWSITHTLLANMGGFAIKCNVGCDRRVSAHLPSIPSKPDGQTDDTGPATHDAITELASRPKTEIKSKSNIERLESNVNPSTSSENWIHLLASDILWLRREGLIPSLPHMTVDEIQDKSKTDAFVRVIAIIQIASTIFQILVRASRHLAVSQLEVSVLAFAGCAFLVYALNWSKPQGVKTPVVILSFQGELPEKISKGGRERRHITWLENMFVHIFRVVGYPYQAQRFGPPINNAYTIKAGYRGHWDFFGLLGGTVIFGSVHIIAWKFEFPCSIEQVLWRVASLYCTVVLPGGLAIFLALLLFAAGISRVPFLRAAQTFANAAKSLALWSTALFSLLYVVARLFLIVEMFRCLFFLPSSAYVGTWASYIPQVG